MLYMLYILYVCVVIVIQSIRNVTYNAIDLQKKKQVNFTVYNTLFLILLARL